MIEAERSRQIARCEEPDISGIVAGDRCPACLCGKNQGDVVLPWVTVRCRIGPELAQIADCKPGFFPGLPYRRVFQGFPVVDKSPGQGPTKRGILTLDQDDSVVDSYNDIDGRNGVAESYNLLSAVRAEMMWLHGTSFG